MKVAMNANFVTVCSKGLQEPQTFGNAAPGTQDEARHFDQLVGKTRQILLQDIENCAGVFTEFLAEPNQVGLREWLRRKVGIGRISAERQMHLRRSAAEFHCGFGREPDRLQCDLGQFGLLLEQQSGWRMWHILRRTPADLFVEAI